MAVQPTQNDSVITVGLDTTEEIERSSGEIATSIGREGEQAAAAEAQQATSEQDQAALREAQELAQAAREHEAAEQGAITATGSNARTGRAGALIQAAVAFINSYSSPACYSGSRNRRWSVGLRYCLAAMHACR